MFCPCRVRRHFWETQRDREGQKNWERRTNTLVIQWPGWSRGDFWWACEPEMTQDPWDPKEAWFSNGFLVGPELIFNGSKNEFWWCSGSNSSDSWYDFHWFVKNFQLVIACKFLWFHLDYCWFYFRCFDVMIFGC